jgi:hypothetical protein
VNAATGGIVTFKASGQTGVSVAVGETAFVYFNGTDYVKVAGTAAVSSFSAGTTGLTPNTATTGAVTLAGTLATTNGGTGLTVFTANQVFYASSTSAFAQSANLTFNGTTLTANTIGAFTLSGTVSGGGNQINNVIIGTTTPLAGAFTTLTASGATTLSAQLTASTNDGSYAIIGKDTRAFSAGVTGPMLGFFGLDSTSTNNALGAFRALAQTTQNGTLEARVLSSGSITTIGTFSTTGLAVTGALSATGNLTISGNGPNAIGGSTSVNRQFSIQGAFNASTNAYGLAISSSLTPSAGSEAALFTTEGTLNKAGSGTHADFAAALLLPPTIGAGAATLTNASTLKITGAPSAGTNNYALWVAGGNVRLDSNVGIGETSPSVALSIKGATADSATIQLRQTASSGQDYRITSRDDGSFRIQSDTAAAERLRIDASGNMGLGVTPSAWWSSRKAFQFGTTGSIASGSGSTLIGDNYYTDNTPTNIYLTTGVATAYQQTTGEHRWYTAPSGTAGNAITFTQAMTLDASSNLMVGTTTNAINDSNSIVIVSNNGSVVGQVICNHATSTGSGERFAAFGYAGSSIGSITQNGTTAVAYNTSSDYRLKENIQDADSASSLIDAIQVRQFNWKSDGSHQRYGFIAQELVTVAPEAVHQPTDTEEMMAVDYSKLVPMLVKEIQSLRQRLSAANL